MPAKAKTARATPPAVHETPRQKTGINALDALLQGGFPVGATILLAGASGTGKTILATQWLFNGFLDHNEPGIYISMTEPVQKALRNAATLSFFRHEAVDPLQVHFTDLRAVMKGMDLDNQDFTKQDIARVVELIRNMCQQSGAKRVVLDSVTAMAYRLRDRDLIRDFIFQLGTMLGQINVNVILTSEVSGEGYGVFGVEEFISDGIIKLSYVSGAEERVRQLEVVKMRGTAFNAHPSVYRIGTDGILMYPYQHRALPSMTSESKISTGIEGLDRMSFGGYFQGSATLITGASGTGKTVTSLHLVQATISSGKRCLYVSMEEAKEQLFKNAKSLGWDFGVFEKKGLLTVLSAFPEQRYLDEHVLAIENALEETGAEVVVVDSLTALANVYSDSMVRDFTGRMAAAFKSRLVASVFTHASEAMLGASGISEAHLSSIFDNILMLRFVEVRSALRHGMLIVKMRGTPHDETLREFVFVPGQGIRISADFSGYEGIMSGGARKTSETIEERLHELLVGTFGPRGEAILAREKAKGLTMESTRALLRELSDQGLLSARRNRDFVDALEKMTGRS